MESNYSKFDPYRGNIYFRRFILILLNVVFAIMAIIQVAVVLNMEFARTLVQEAMGVGAIFSIFVAIMVWKDKAKNEVKLWVCLVYTLIAAGSLVGIFMTIFVTLTLWVNAIISVMFFIGMALSFSHGWKDLVDKPAGS